MHDRVFTRRSTVLLLFTSRRRYCVFFADLLLAKALNSLDNELRLIDFHLRNGNRTGPGSSDRDSNNRTPSSLFLVLFGLV